MFNGNAAYNAGGAVFGGTSINCLFTNNSSYYGGAVNFGWLSNCVLTGNHAGGGGAANTSSLINCILTNNSAQSGGALSDCYATNCVIARNTAQTGGGVSFSFVLNCTIVDNAATSSAGGVYYGTTPINRPGGGFNCIIISNTAPTHENYVTNYKLAQFCCTTPTNIALGNIAADPRFVDAPAGDYRLQSDSPCINSGMSSYFSGAADLAGKTRVTGGTVDLGAYEFQTPPSRLSFAWAQNHNIAIDGSSDFADPDHDGANNYAEWMADTDPNDATSYFKIDTVTATPTYTTIYFNSVSNRSYTVLASSNVESGFLPILGPYTGRGLFPAGTPNTVPRRFLQVRVSLP